MGERLMTMTTLRVTTEESMAVYLPSSSGKPPDELEETWRLPSYIPPITFIPAWKPRGDKMRPGIKAAWCDALCSGRFTQIKGKYSDHGSGRCAVGVLYEVCHEFAQAADRGLFPDEFATIELVGLSDAEYCRMVDTVINMNDNRGMTFAAIADLIGATW